MTSVVSIPSTQFNRRKNSNENSAVTARQHLQIALKAKEMLWYWNATHTSFLRKGYTERGEWGRSDILWKWTKIYATSVSFVFSMREGTPMTISELKPHLFFFFVLMNGLLPKAKSSDITHPIFDFFLYWRQGAQRAFDISDRIQAHIKQQQTSQRHMRYLIPILLVQWTVVC